MTFPELREALPPSMGRQVFPDGSLILRASRELRFRNGGYLWVSVSDYTNASARLQAEQQLIQSPGKDYESQQLEFIHLPDGLGYVLWDPISRNGRFRAIVANRFLLQAEGGDMPTRIPWVRIAEFFPLDRYRRESVVQPN